MIQVNICQAQRSVADAYHHWRLQSHDGPTTTWQSYFIIENSVVTFEG